MRHFIFIGAPGSGKGTQAERIAKEFGHRHISTGDLLRKEIDEQSEIGQRVQDLINKGQLTDDALILELIKKNVHFDNHYYIFDGYPRSVEQAISVHEDLLLGQDYLVVFFSVSLENMVKRLTNRRMCEKCGAIYNKLADNIDIGDACPACFGKIYKRHDDEEVVIRDRLQLHQKKSKPILQYFRDNGRLLEIDAERSIEKIYQILKGHVRRS